MFIDKLLMNSLGRKLIFTLSKYPRIYSKIRRIYRSTRRFTFTESINNLSFNPGPWQVKTENPRLITIVTRDIPMYDRAGSYLRLHEIISILQIMNLKVRILSMNSIARQKSIWNLTGDGINKYLNIYRDMGVEVLTDGISALNIIQSNVSDQKAYWIHEVSVAQDFIANFKGKVPFNHLILDTVDLEFRRLLQLGDKSGYESGLRLLRAVSNYVDDVVLITKEEEEIFNKNIEEILNRTFVLSNIYPEFRPTNQDFKNSFEYDLLFVGNFLHHPNILAASYIIDQLSPKLKGTQIALVGPNLPDEFTRRIESRSECNISYLGQIEELSKVYESSRIVVAPLGVGAGIKGKVLEGLRHGKPVVGTTIAWEGIPRLNRNIQYEASLNDNFLEKIGEATQNPPILTLEDCASLNSLFSRNQSLKILSEIFA